MVSWGDDSVKVLTARRFYRRQIDGYRIALAWTLKARSESILQNEESHSLADKANEVPLGSSDVHGAQPRIAAKPQ
jgi:hypothetical protein